MATRPSTAKGQAKVQPGHGIKVNYLYYWSDAFRNPNVEKTLVPVRYDPFDMGVAYAYVDGRWVRCISQYYSTFVGRTEKEVLLAASEIRHLNKRSATSTNLNAKNLADFIANVQEHEALLLQRLRDLESQQMMDNLTSSHSSSPSVNQVQPKLVVVAPESKDVALHVPSQNVKPLDVSSLPILGEYK